MPHILIVDDEPRIAFFLHETLTSLQPKFEVSAVETAAAALRIARQVSPDLVITDYRLADMDGLNLARALKRLDQSLPIIMITAGEPPAEGSEAEAGIIHRIRKPFSATRLMATVNQVLEEASSNPVSGDRSTTGRDSHPREPDTHTDSGDDRAPGRDPAPRGPGTRRTDNDGK